MLVNIHEAKTHLSRLIQRVRQGEEIVIGHAGTPVARLIRYEDLPRRREPGAWRGRVTISPDFDDLPPEIAAAFRGDRK